MTLEMNTSEAGRCYWAVAAIDLIGRFCQYLHNRGQITIGEIHIVTAAKYVT